MTAFDLLRYSIKDYSTLGHWSQPRDFPGEVLRKTSIRVLQDNLYMVKGSKAAAYYMQVLIDMPDDAPTIAEGYWNMVEVRDHTASFEETFVDMIAQALFAACTDGCWSDFCTNMFDVQEAFVVLEHKAISNYYDECPLHEKAAFAVIYLVAKKYEDWLREEVYLHGLTESDL